MSDTQKCWDTYNADVAKCQAWYDKQYPLCDSAPDPEKCRDDVTTKTGECLGKALDRLLACLKKQATTKGAGREGGT